MAAAMLSIVSAALFGWLVLLGLPWQPWRLRERFRAGRVDVAADLSDVTVLVPARNEAAVLGDTLAALADQGSGLHVIVVDDDSDDGTAEIAQTSGLEQLTVLRGQPLPEGWTGKLWALEQACKRVHTPRILLLDADIRLAPGTIAGLCRKMDATGCHLVSLMAWLRMERMIERLFMPAFIYFFKLIYPFALSNRGSRFVAAAAGGCMLLDARVLGGIGGFASLRDAVIDDCTLAARFRAAGARTWVGVTRDAVSTRGYDQLAPIHAMVARTAYTQLRYSPWLLIACTLVMGVMFVAPVAGLVAGDAPVRAVALAAYTAMALSYGPTLRYYGLTWAWSLALPLIGLLYLGMTWSSAWRYTRGVRTAWRGRVYARR